MVKANRWSGAWGWVMAAAVVCCTILSPGAQADDADVLRMDVNRVEVNVDCDWQHTEAAGELNTPAAMVEMVEGHPRFVVIRPQAEGGHVWYSRWFNRPVDIVERYPILVMTYRATGYDTQSRDYTFSIRDGMGNNTRHHLRPLMCKAVVSDGTVQTFRQDLRKVSRGRPMGPVLQMGVALWADEKGKATFELLSVAFERDPAATTKANADAMVFKKDQPVSVNVLDFMGQPLAGAKVSVNTMIKGFEQQAMTDAQGRALISPWTNEQQEYWLTISHEGMVTTVVSVKPGETAKVRLAEAREVTGDVVDDLGRPLSGAIVQFMPNPGEIEVELPPKQWRQWPGRVMTDEQGRWSQRGFARDWRTMSAVVWHPEVVPPYKFELEINQPNVVNLAVLEKQIPPVHIVGHNGWSITGKVLDDHDKPVHRAMVYVGTFASRYFNPAVAITDEAGVYRVNQLTEPQTLLTVMKPGHGPVKMMVDAPQNWQTQPLEALRTQDLKMTPPGTLRIRVVDGQNKPIPGVSVTVPSWGEFKGRLWTAKTNSEGLAQWNDAPDSPVNVTLYHNRVSQPAGSITAGDADNVLVLQGPTTIQGTLVDASTGKIIDHFIVRYATPKPTDKAEDMPDGVSDYRWQEHEIITGKQGKYSLTINDASPRRFLRFHALGYKPVTSRAISSSEGSLTFDVKMTPGWQYNGIVLTPDGKPAQGASVFGVESGKGVAVYTGPMLQLLRSQSGFSAETDEQGMFVVNDQISSEKLVAVGVIHESGYMELRGDGIDDVKTIKLLPWVTVKGVSRVGNEPDSRGKIVATQLSNPLDPARPGELVKADLPAEGEKQDDAEAAKRRPRANWHVNDQGEGYYRADITWGSQVDIDSQGRFEMKLPAGGYEIGKLVSNGNLYEMYEPKLMYLKTGVDIQNLQFGGVGRSVTAKLVWPAKPQAWKHAHSSLIFIPDENAPLTITRLSDELPDGPDLSKLINGYAIKCDGPVVTVDEYNILRAGNVVPGTYDLQVNLYDQDEQGISTLVGMVGKRIVVEAEADKQAQKTNVVDLGQMEIELPAPIQ